MICSVEGTTQQFHSLRTSLRSHLGGPSSTSTFADKSGPCRSSAILRSPVLFPSKSAEFPASVGKSGNVSHPEHAVEFFEHKPVGTHHTNNETGSAPRSLKRYSKSERSAKTHVCESRNSSMSNMRRCSSAFQHGGNQTFPSPPSPQLWSTFSAATEGSPQPVHVTTNLALAAHRLPCICRWFSERHQPSRLHLQRF